MGADEKEKDIQKRIEKLQKKLEIGRGDERAMFELAKIYAGYSKYRDLDQAVYWLRRIREKEDRSQEVEDELISYAEGLCGLGGGDNRIALEILKPCGDSQDEEIRYKLGILEAAAGNVEAAMVHFGFVARKEHKAEYGGQSYFASKSVDEIVLKCLWAEDEKEAVRWLETALEQDDRPEKTRLSDEGTLGDIVINLLAYRARQTDGGTEKAARFFRAAAESENLSLKRSALCWFEDKSSMEQAAELGSGAAMYWLGQYYMERCDSEKDHQKGLEWYRKAAEKHVVDESFVRREIEAEQRRNRRKAIRRKVQGKFAELGLTEEKVQKLEKPIVIGKQHFDRLIFRSGELRRRYSSDGSIEEYNGLRYFTEVKVEDIKAGKIEGCFYADSYPGICFHGIALVDDYAYTREGELIDMSRPYMKNNIVYYDTEAVINCTPFLGPDPLRRIPEEIQELMREADPDADARDQDEVRQFLALMEQRGKDAPEVFLNLKENGNETVCVMLAESYENGTCGLEKDEKKAAKLYRRAAKQGDCDACARLGDLYRTGRGVLVNRRRALIWYDKAINMLSYNRSQRGVAIAQIGMGMLYCEGKGGISINPEYAFELWRKVADSEFPVERARARELLDTYGSGGQEAGTPVKEV